MKRRWTNLNSFAWVALLAGAAHGADAVPLGDPARALELAQRGEKILWLRTGAVDLATRPNALKQKSFAKGAHVLLLDGPMTRERRQALQGAGVRVGDALPMNAFLVDPRDAAPLALATLPFVLWAGAYGDAWRVDPALLKGRCSSLVIECPGGAQEEGPAIRVDLAFPRRDSKADACHDREDQRCERHVPGNNRWW